MTRPADPPPRERRFYLAPDGTVMLAGRFNGLDRVDHRVATDEDLACLVPFGRRVLELGEPWDVSICHWTAQRALRRPAENEA